MHRNLILAALAAAATPAAAHTYDFPTPDPAEPDIELLVHQEGEHLHIESALPLWFSVTAGSSFQASGGSIETIFPGFAAGEHDHEGEDDHTEEPGHDHDHVPFATNLALFLDPVATLRVWDDVAQQFVAADHEQIGIFNFAGGVIYDTVVGGATIGTGGFDADGLTPVKIGTTDPTTGDLHAHVTWILLSTMGNPDPGAYLLEIEVSAAGYETSEPIPLLFNYGLNDEAFDAAVDGAVALYNIPEPGALALLAVMAPALLRRRH